LASLTAHRHRWPRRQADCCPLAAVRSPPGSP